MNKFKIRKDDQVIIIAGKSKGKTGKVLKVLRETNRVIVQNANVVRMHKKPSSSSPGGITEKEASIHISNVAFFDEKAKKRTKIGYKYLKDGSKVRYSKKSNETILN